VIQIKQPAEKLAFGYDFAAQLGAAAIALVLHAAAETRGAGAALVSAGQEVVGQEVRILWTGGSDGESYLTTVRVRDSLGQEHELEGEIAVIDARWTMPDGGAPYLSIAEFVARFGLDETVRMTDALGNGRIDRQLLVSALGDVQAIADAYLAARFSVPLAEAPAIVKTAIADMARARLYPRGAPEGIAEAGKAALKLLERIAEGKLALPALAPIAAAPSASLILVDAGTRLYPRGGWSDY
jgi:phage gp36-like protein